MSTATTATAAVDTSVVGPPKAPRADRPVRAVAAAGLLGGVATASGVALTATSGWLIVSASQRPVILTLLTAIVAVRAFGIARPVFRYWERLRSHDAALGELSGRRTATYAALVPLTPARLGRRGRADLLTGVVDDLDDAVDARVRVTVPVLSLAVAGVVAVAVAAALVPAAGLVVLSLLAASAAACWLAWRLESTSQPTVLAARAEVARVASLVSSSATEIAAVGAGQRALTWLRAAHEDLASATARQSRGRALASGLLLVLTVAATLTMVLAVRPLVGHTVTTPVAALLVLIPVALGDALSSLPDAVRALARSQASEVRLHHLLDQDPAVAAAGAGRLDQPAPAAGEPARDGALTTSPARPPYLALHAVTAAWAGSTPQLGPVDLEMAPGTRLAVTGANGCGKSTMLAVLARQLDPSGGVYSLDGRDATGLDLDEVRARFAVMDDEPHVFATTLRENLRLAGPGADDDAIVGSLRLAGLGTWLERLPAGLDTMLGSGGRGVSGGERARLGLARALLSGRPVLLLDEPVAHLDHATATAVLADVLAGAGDRTVVMVSHRPDGLAAFDRVIDLGVPASGATDASARARR